MNRRCFSLAGCLLLLLAIAAMLYGLAGCASPGPAGAQIQASSPLEVNLLGKVAQFNLDSRGRLTSGMQLTSADGRMTLAALSGTSILANSRPASSLVVSADSQPPMLPEGANIIGGVYDVAPAGVSFNPPLQLTVTFGPEDVAQCSQGLQPGVENAICAAVYANGSWTELSYKRVDTVNRKITTTIDSSAKLAVLMNMANCPSTAPGGADSAPTPTAAPAPQAAANAVKVVVAGYMNHGPLRPTVQAIKDVLAKYGNKVDVTWVDLGTSQGAAYFKANNLTAHMNVIINGKYTYKVNGKDVTFQWFEGQQWTRQDLDTVLAGLVS